jgi:hypothetical protein
MSTIDRIEIQIRCPNGPQRLFMKLLSTGERPTVVPDLNLMELACSDCARQMKKTDKDIFRVLHRYAIDGSLVESVIVWIDETETVIGGFE